MPVWVSPTIYPRGGARAGWGETRQVDTRHGHTAHALFRALFSLLRLSGGDANAEQSRAISAVHERYFYRIHHAQSSQSISIYGRGIGAKISVSVSISRFLRHENLLYLDRVALSCVRA